MAAYFWLHHCYAHFCVLIDLVIATVHGINSKTVNSIDYRPRLDFMISVLELPVHFYNHPLANLNESTNSFWPKIFTYWESLNRIEVNLIVGHNESPIYYFNRSKKRTNINYRCMNL